VVAIADVSHYVQPGTALDREASERGNSVYFPRRVIPMLPEKLSNGLCSLNPDVDRLAMVCDMNIDASGVITDYEFYAAIFRSQARLTYDQVWNWLAGTAQPESEVHRRLQPQLQALYALFKVLSEARGKRGAIDFETIETMMLFNEQGKIDNIVPVHRNDAHRVIEECMLAANVCASGFLQANRQPCLYRIHEGPTPGETQALRNFLKEFALGLGGGDDPTASDYADLLESIKERPDAQLLQTVMLRSLRQASTARTMSAISVFPTSITRTSLHRSGAIRTSWYIARSRRHSPARATHRANGPRSACTARRPSAVPTRRRATSATG
jgi:ribonuclease R